MSLGSFVEMQNRVSPDCRSCNFIQEYEYHEYEPQAKTNLNSAGEIVISIELQDLFSHPSESYLVFEGRLTKNDNTAYVNADAIALTNSGIMYLFSNTSYRLSNQEIESVHHPGQATTMLGLLKYPDEFSKAQGLNQLWQKDTATTAVIADNEGFKIRQRLTGNRCRRERWW